jgi:hypothetical protein
MTRRKKLTRAELQAAIAQAQMTRDTTLLMEVARDPTYSAEMRMAAAKAALPLHHTPISPIDDEKLGV